MRSDYDNNIIICIIISAKCLKQTARDGGSILKTEAGEVSQVHIRKGFTEPEGTVEDHFSL